MNNLKSHFRFNKQERSGIFFLLLIIISLQVGYYVYGKISVDGQKETLVIDDKMQKQIDALKQVTLEEKTLKIYPFNPNFITDYKGYTLGMSLNEIDRLHTFREQGKFANTKKEFQEVTQVSDSLLNAISPYFKFPEWTKRSKKFNRNRAHHSSENLSDRSASSRTKAFDGKGLVKTSNNIVIKDLNTVTVSELRSINGIGEKLSARIVKFRNRLGGFLIDDQLYDVYGLEPEVVKRTLQHFKVLQRPDISKININTAPSHDIASLVYIQKRVAESIVDYRNDNNGILSLDELENIEGFPFDKIDRIALYLSL